MRAEAKRYVAAEPTDLVWLQTGFIGDLVLTTAGIEAAKTHWPMVRQHVITTRLGAEVFKGSLPVTTRIVFAKSEQPMLQAMRQVKKELQETLEPGGRAVLLQAHRSTRSSLLSAYLKLPTVAYDESAGAYLADWRVPRVSVLHEAHRIALLLEAIGVPRELVTSSRPRLTSLPLTAELEWQKTLAVAASQYRLVAVAPGSVWGTKRWTPEGFAALTRALLELPGMAVVFIGSPAEEALAAKIAASVGSSPRLFNLVGLTSLDDMRRVLPLCSLLVANDSSPVHFASALGVKTLELFGATVPGMGFGPLAPGSRTLGTDLPCRPCSDHGPQVCPLGHFRCMRELLPVTVFAACRDLLALPALTP